MNKFRLIAAALLVAVLACGISSVPVFAQASELTGGLRGKVTGDDGSPLPGVTLVLSSRNLIRDQVLVTDADGNFFSPNLPPGDYRITMQLTGYVTTIVETNVVLGQMTVLNLAMKAGEISEEITVTSAKPVVEKTETESAVVLDKEFTEKLPVGRTYQSLMQFAPGVTGGSNANILGGTSNSNDWVIDGVSFRDPVTGTFGANINYDAIEVVDVKLTGISAEYGQFQGGLTNIITKSGGNTFTGSLRDTIRQGRWTELYSTSKISQYFLNGNAPTEFYGPEDDPLQHTVEFTIGGPIVPDSAWFFVAYNRPDTQGTATLGNQFGGPNSDGNWNNFFLGDYSTGKATWQVTDQHRVQLQYTEDPADTSRDYGALFFGPGAFDTQNIDLQSQGGFFWVGNWTASWTSNFVTDIKGSHFENGFGIAPLTSILPPFPGQPLSSTGQVGFYWDLFGSGHVYDANIFDESPEERLRDQWEASATMFFDTSLGTHTLKVGAEYQEQETVGSSVIQGDSYFIGGFLSDPAGAGGCGDACAYDIDNRVYYIWYDFAPGNQVGPTNEYTAIYIQDDWQLNENLSLNLGIRYEDTANENDLGEAIIDQADFAPRLGAAWDITGEGRHVVKATAARYLAGINLTTLSAFVRQAGGQSSYDIYFNDNFPSAGIPDWTLIGSVRPSPGSSQFDDDINVQYIDEYTLGYEFGFSPTMGLKFKYIDRSWEEIVTVRNFYEYPGGVPTKIQRIGNNDAAERSYKGFQLQFDKRFSDNWELSANYVNSESEGNVTTDSGFDTFGNYAGVPQSTENRFGLLPWDVEHNFKVQGYYIVPLKSTRHSVTLGSTFEYESGNPYARQRNSNTIVVGPGPDGIQDVPLGSSSAGGSDDQRNAVFTLLEPRGSRNEPSNWVLNLNVGYGFNFTRDVRFEARFEMFNVTNEQKPLTISAEDNVFFGYARALSDFQAPRSWRFNVALLW